MFRYRSAKFDNKLSATLFSNTAMHNMRQGISLFDEDLKLKSCNQQFMELLDFPEHLREPGTPFADFIRFNAERGEYGEGDIEEQVAQRVRLANQFIPHHFERARNDGSVLDIEGKPVEGVGFVTTYSDITERKKTEDELKRAKDTAEAATAGSGRLP